MSERLAGLETGNVEADPPGIRGRLTSVGKRAARAPTGSTGAVAAARMEEGYGSNTGSSCGGQCRPTGNPGGRGWAAGVADGSAVVRIPGNAGGAKGPCFERDV